MANYHHGFNCKFFVREQQITHVVAPVQGDDRSLNIVCHLRTVLTVTIYNSAVVLSLDDMATLVTYDGQRIHRRSDCELVASTKTLDLTRSELIAVLTETSEDGVPLLHRDWFAEFGKASILAENDVEFDRLRDHLEIRGG